MRSHFEEIWSSASNLNHENTTLNGAASVSEALLITTFPCFFFFSSSAKGRQLWGLNLSIKQQQIMVCIDDEGASAVIIVGGPFIIINIIKWMWNKTHTQSNEETQDGEEEDRESNVRGLLEQTVPIVDVWSHNFDAELQILSQMAKYYPVVAFDTEFPGSLVTRPSLANYYAPEELDYQHTWHNVERTKLIQVGFTLADHNGALPPRNATWQFHLQFDLQRESLVPESIQMLRAAGIDFQKLRTNGIPHRRFAQGLFASGLILNKNIKWVVFHGCFDFGYLLRELRREPLPRTAEEFYKSLKIYFPCIYDLKQILKDQEEFRQGGLAAISQRIGCARVGPQHQAGSDSLLTLNCYFRLRKILGDLHFQERANSIFGIAGEQKQKMNSYSMMSYPQGYQMSMYGYLSYNHSYQMPHQHNQTGFQKQWPH